jgi:penicillin-binding protein 1C
MRRSLKLKRQQRPKRLALWLGLAIIPTVSLLSILAILGALTALGGTIALAASSVLLEDLPDVRSVAAFEDSLFENSSVYSADGTKLGEIASEGRRTLLAADEIPQLVKDAVIASEDSSFYENPGVDLWAIVRAVWLNLQGQAIVSGFSTITQQVVKNTLLSPEQSVERKLREVVLAYQLTQSLSKDEILALYLNQNNYGNMAYGIRAAAKTYFDHDLQDLTLAEVAMLVGIPRAPSTQNPIADQDTATRIQHNVLDLMVKSQFITISQANEAKQQILVYRLPESEAGPAPHFFTYVVDYLNDKYGPEWTRNGWRVTTTIDLDLQKEVEQIARAHLETLSDLDAHNAAVVVLNPSTGEILAMLGSVDFGDVTIDGQVNMAIAPRQPGSAFKPITYVTALQKGYTAATVLMDLETIIEIPGQEPYEPVNYDEKFHGPVRLREALASSLNIPAVHAQIFAGIAGTLDTAAKFGMRIEGGIERFGPALALGAGEVPLLDMATGFGVFASGGVRIEPNPIIQIRDSQGNTIEDVTKPIQARVLSAELAFLMTDILADPQARIMGFGNSLTLTLENRAAAVKTGTTNDFRDALTVGYTPQRVVAVWVGNADRIEMDGVSGSKGAGPIWNKVMKFAHRNLPAIAFARPTGLLEADIDPVSGLIPGKYTPQTMKEYFIPGTIPGRRDSYHQPIRIHEPSGKRAGPTTPTDEVTVQTFPVLPPEASKWQQEQPDDSPFYLPPQDYATALDSPKPLRKVSIAIPSQNQQVRSILEIVGSAEGEGLINFTLEVGAGVTPSEWGLIAGPIGAPRSRTQLGAVDTIQLPDGIYTLRLTVNRVGGTSEMAFRQFAVDNTSPTVRIVGIESGATLPRGQVALNVESADNTGIKSVSYFVGGELVGTAEATPYQVIWGSAPGNSEVVAVAIDQAGNRTESEAVDFRVP